MYIYYIMSEQVTTITAFPSTENDGQIFKQQKNNFFHRTPR